MVSKCTRLSPALVSTLGVNWVSTMFSYLKVIVRVNDTTVFSIATEGELFSYTDEEVGNIAQEFHEKYNQKVRSIHNNAVLYEYEFILRVEAIVNEIKHDFFNLLEKCHDKSQEHSVPTFFSSETIMDSNHQREVEYEKQKQADRSYYQRQQSKLESAKSSGSEEKIRHYQNKTKFFKEKYKSDYDESPRSTCIIN